MLEGRGTVAARPAEAPGAWQGAGRAGGASRVGREGVTLSAWVRSPAPAAMRGVRRRGLRGRAVGESPSAKGVGGVWGAVSVSRGCCRASKEPGFLSAVSGGAVRRCLLALW